MFNYLLITTRCWWFMNILSTMESSYRENKYLNIKMIPPIEFQKLTLFFQLQKDFMSQGWCVVQALYVIIFIITIIIIDNYHWFNCEKYCVIVSNIRKWKRQLNIWGKLIILKKFINTEFFMYTHAMIWLSYYIQLLKYTYIILY